jgi:hypothetical protein
MPMKQIGPKYLAGTTPSSPSYKLLKNTSRRLKKLFQENMGYVVTGASM